MTARKREEALKDVPFSLAVQTAEDLKKSGAVNIEDISRGVAGFSVQNLGPGQSQVAVRGVSAGQIVRDQPGVKEQVGIYLDESVISLSLFTPDLDLYDLSRVEVLRGPQGTLFGSGSLSGTVRYITAQPVLEETSASITAGAETITDGDWGGLNGSKPPALMAAKTASTSSTSKYKVVSFKKACSVWLMEKVLSPAGQARRT